MLASLVGDRHAAEHPSDFFDARIVREWRDLRARGSSIGQLRHSQVLIAKSCHLRQMRHAEHLRRRTERGKFATDDFGYGATYP